MNPKGNPRYTPLTLTDAQYTVPKQAGWPRVFVADAVSNRGNGRWFLVFARQSAEAPWKAVYLASLADNEIPQFKTDRDGYAEVVPAGGNSGLKVDPGKLGERYADYLGTGRGDTFASGPHTDGWRSVRAKLARKPGSRLQWEDQPADYAPVALRTKDGGALVFFSTYYHQQKTFAPGTPVIVAPALKGIMEGPVKKKTQKMTFTTISEQTVKVPTAGSAQKVTFLHRLEAKTSAKTL
ncbi:hypothetical protein [Streptomyces sp. MST-110588]|uniref:hypothetical protein n=1 Tax=Streptomyces sp. MST-110588 TaxID=2833628 RepID=UPI003241E4EB